MCRLCGQEASMRRHEYSGSMTLCSPKATTSQNERLRKVVEQTAWMCLMEERFLVASPIAGW
jgi:hypothetical protein